MSDKQKEPRAGNSKRRHFSGDRNRRRAVSEKSQAVNRPKLELLPSSIMNSVHVRNSVPNLTGVTERGQKSKMSVEHPKYSTNRLCLTDCCHFLRGHCKKGNECNFRHQESARTATIVCRFWLKNECTNLKCSFLHYKSLPLGHEKIPCHFEQREGGCKKADCDFFHELPRRSNSGVLSEHLTEALKNVRLSKESEKETYTECAHCGTDIRGKLALKTGSLFQCISCAEMMK